MMNKIKYLKIILSIIRINAINNAQYFGVYFVICKKVLLKLDFLQVDVYQTSFKHVIAFEDHERKSFLIKKKYQDYSKYKFANVILFRVFFSLCYAFYK